MTTIGEDIRYRFKAMKIFEDNLKNHNYKIGCITSGTQKYCISCFLSGDKIPCEGY